jgi:hypothetical protein
LPPITDAHRDTGHTLHARGDGDVVLARHDALRREVHGLLGRTALTVNRRRRDRLGPAGCQQRVAANVEGLFPDLHDTARDDVIYQRRVEVVAVCDRLEGMTEKVDRVPVLQRSIALSARGTDGIDDDCSLHVAP